MKYFIILIPILLLSNSLSAQKQYLEKNKKYQIAKIYQRGENAVKVNNLILSDDTLVQYNLNEYESTSSKKVISTTNIRYIAVKNGTYAGSYAAIGGGIGLLSAIYGVQSVKTDPFLDDSKVNWASFVVGFTAGGAALGALIGATKIKWKMVYIPDKKTSYNFNLSPNFGKNYCGLGLHVTF